MLKTILIILAVLWVLGTILDQTATHSAWSSEMQLEPARIMVRKNIGGCGVIEFRTKSNNDGSWQVRCSPDGVSPWKYYEVLMWTEVVLGPYSSEAELP